MNAFKQTLMLAFAIFLILSWNLALSSATTPLVAHYGVWGCLFFAGAISGLCAWILMALHREM